MGLLVEEKFNGTVDKYKSRFIARDLSQNYELDYEETFSLVTKMITKKKLLFFLLQHLKIENSSNLM